METWQTRMMFLFSWPVGTLPFLVAFSLLTIKALKSSNKSWFWLLLKQPSYIDQQPCYKWSYQKVLGGHTGQQFGTEVSKEWLGKTKCWCCNEVWAKDKSSKAVTEYTSWHKPKTNGLSQGLSHRQGDTTQETLGLLFHLSNKILPNPSVKSPADWTYDGRGLCMLVRRPLLAAWRPAVRFGPNTGMLCLKRQAAVFCNPQENPLSAFCTKQSESLGRNGILGYFYFFSSVSKGHTKKATLWKRQKFQRPCIDVYKT